MWNDFLATLEGKKAGCSCGEQAPDETFKVHLRKAHWWKSLRGVKIKAENDDDDDYDDEAERRLARSKKTKR